jgi:dipeptidyl aminopeptidase/acylaminoacyl peptidase
MLGAADVQAAAPLEAYGELPLVEAISLSPNGKRLAFVGKIAGERRIVLFDPENTPISGIPLGDLKFFSIVWAGDDLAIARLRWTQRLGMEFTTDKAELVGAAIISATGEKPQWVFQKTPGLSTVIGEYAGARFVDGKWLGYFGGVKYNREKPKGFIGSTGRPGLFAVDLQANKPVQVAAVPGEGHWRNWLVDGGGVVQAALDLSVSTGNWKIVNRLGKPLASGTEQTGSIDFVGFTHDGSGLVYSTEGGGEEKTRWMQVSLAGGQPSDMLPGIDIDRAYVDPTDGRLLGYLPSATQHPVLFDADKQAILDKVYRAFPDLHVNVVEWTPSFGHILVHTSGNRDSGTWFLVDMASLTADPIGYDRTEIGADEVGPISVVPYKASDGLEMDGILTLPPGKPARNLPVIMFPHGGPNAQDRPEFDWWAQAFASRGYAVFQPNFRGSTNRDLAFLRAGDGEWGRKMQSDISDGLAALAAKGIVDPRRACIMGASYGGYAALAGVTLQQGLYRCAVAVAPVSDVALMYSTNMFRTNQNRIMRRALERVLGIPSQYDEISPRRFAAQADAPILLVHGMDDTVVPFNQSKVMADALKKAGKPYELVTLKEEDHFLSRSPTRIQMLDAAMRFIQKYNPAD